jgi:hypothetical protein
VVQEAPGAVSTGGLCLSRQQFPAAGANLRNDTRPRRKITQTELCKSWPHGRCFAIFGGLLLDTCGADTGVRRARALLFLRGIP